LPATEEDVDRIDAMNGKIEREAIAAPSVFPSVETLKTTGTKTTKKR